MEFTLLLFQLNMAFVVIVTCDISTNHKHTVLHVIDLKKLKYNLDLREIVFYRQSNKYIGSKS